MKKQPLFVAFTNQKGGVGKSALTVLMASWLHYTKEKNVLVVDCDYPQYSLINMRERDKQAVLKNSNYKKMLMEQAERTDKKAYTILSSQPGDAVRTANNHLRDSDMEYDLVLCDLSGSINAKGMLTTVFNMDFIFIPIIADRLVMQSSMSFATTIQDYLSDHKDLPLRGIHILWNQVDSRASKEVFNMYNQIMARLGLNVLNTILPRASRYGYELSVTGKPFFRSTLFPPCGKMLKNSNFDILAQEIMDIINL